MKLAIEIGRVRPGQLDLMTEWVLHAERCGVAMAFSAEAWWSDSVTPLAYLASPRYGLVRLLFPPTHDHVS